ncbi:hypothetical protein BDZ89DRAFT_1071577 [Hymenopellis radicata]|nr:hypothetical protein BDZ89DRAFT_1071577 [Hymenopellis radicata]
MLHLWSSRRLSPTSRLQPQLTLHLPLTSTGRIETEELRRHDMIPQVSDGQLESDTVPPECGRAFPGVGVLTAVWVVTLQ